MESNRGVRRLPILALLVVAAGLIAGCGTGENGSTDDITAGADGETTDDGQPTSIDLDTLTASTWTLRFGGGPDGEIPLVDGWPITITFGPDTFGGTAACNGYGGTFAIDGNRIDLTELSWTEMGCESEVQASETAFLSALPDVDGINLTDEELALSGPATELIFAPAEPAPVDALVDRVWLLEGLTTDDETTEPQGEPATLRLDRDGSFTGSTGCRTLTGRYVVVGNSIDFNEMGADGDCPTSLFEQDSLVVGVLGDGFEPTVDGDTLTVLSVGNQSLQYRAVGEDELSAEPGSPAAGDAELLDGVEWIFTGGDSPNGPIADPRTIDPAASITLTFTAGRYEGVVICNRYGGRADIGDSLWAFTLTVPEAEEEGCGDGLDQIAAAYLTALPQMTEGGIENGGTGLVMNGNDIELLFELSR